MPDSEVNIVRGYPCLWQLSRIHKCDTAFAATVARGRRACLSLRGSIWRGEQQRLPGRPAVTALSGVSPPPPLSALWVGATDVCRRLCWEENEGR